MTNRLSLDMLKATRLTRAGRLVEATEFLQQVLRRLVPERRTSPRSRIALTSAHFASA